MGTPMETPKTQGRPSMRRIAKKFKSFQEAEAWEKKEAQSMSVDQRLAIAKALRSKVFGSCKDVRQCQSHAQ